MSNYYYSKMSHVHFCSPFYRKKVFFDINVVMRSCDRRIYLDNKCIVAAAAEEIKNGKPNNRTALQETAIE